MIQPNQHSPPLKLLTAAPGLPEAEGQHNNVQRWAGYALRHMTCMGSSGQRSTALRQSCA